MADVSIANTTANVSGQTVLLGGRDQTVTGLHTFDRDPSAPFAVSANSAKVSNLDADLLDGLDWSTATAWTSYTPTWTGTGGTPSVGNGTIAGSYMTYGKFAVVRISLTWGSTTTANTATGWNFSIPVTSASGALLLAGALCIDGATTYYNGVCYNGTTTTISAVANNLIVGATTPFTWANTDVLYLTALIQVA